MIKIVGYRESCWRGSGVRVSRGGGVFGIRILYFGFFLLFGVFFGAGVLSEYWEVFVGWMSNK